MAASDRGRSPSAGRPEHLRHSASASSHSPLDSSLHGAVTSGHSSDFPGLSPQSVPGPFADPTFTQDFSQQAQYSLGPTYPGFQDQQPQSQPDHHHHHHQQQQGIDFPVDGSQQAQGAQSFSTNAVDSSAFPSFDFNQTSFDSANSLDPSLLSDFDPSTLDLLPSQTSQGNPAVSLDSMATALQSHSPTPPHLGLGMAARRQSGSPSPNASPNFHQTQFQAMQQRPRNTSESLDPSSAMFPQGQQNEWMNMGAYRPHKRTPSDNLSDISSNHASPYMATMDSFDAANSHSSPLLHSSDPSFSDGLGLQGFSLNDGQPQVANYASPGHSPGHSPHLMPQAQHGLPTFTADGNFGVAPGMNGQYALSSQQQNGLEMFPGVGQEPFPSLHQQGLSPREPGQADHMSPPEINIDYAPPSKPVERMNAESSGNALSPPLRSSRVRAKSDSYAGSRPSSPAISGRGRSPSLQPQGSSDSLSPFDNQPPSRSASPARGRSGSGSRGRSSSNASDQRDYILDLADPQRSPSNGSSSRPVQKHPATFQCHLCPKRFTRAYNLRSHLRTHTDERPFVCTVCGKAFARQHDRKRHEGLHSGEKKFVCRGQLQSGAQWGCGRRFARADALGRHFRSEAGRVCIRPLLDEEAAERQKAWLEEQQQAQVAAGYVAPQPLMAQPQVDLMGNFLPAALIQQYPALAGLDWSNMPQGPPPDEDYISGRSSFDASSGGEYYEDMSENEMNPYQDQNMTGISNMNLQQQQQQQQQQQSQMSGMSAQAGAQATAFGGVYGGHQTGDYLSDFEGR